MDVECRYYCNVCCIRFESKSSLRRHDKKFHPEEKQLEETHTFYSNEDFKAWKYDVEKATCASFIRRNGSVTNASGSEVTYYKCHRSGKYEPLKDRKRRLKLKGSIKSGNKCSAFLKVIKTSMNGGVEIIVTFKPTHTGHADDPGTLNLASPEKNVIGAQITQGVPKKRILQNSEGIFSPTKRLSLTSTTRDLHNIASSFDLDNSIIMNKNDAISVDSTVRKRRSESDNPVILNKMQGEIIINTNPRVQRETTELQEISKELRKGRVFSSYEDERAMCQSLLQESFSKLSCAKSREEMMKVRKRLQTVVSDLNSFTSECTLPTTSLLSVPVNKSITPQRTRINFQRKKQKENTVSTNKIFSQIRQ